jgi:secreted protein with Ig-like and vWFA domain
MTGAPLEMVKAEARRTVEVLTAREAFEVITFDSSPSRVVEMACGNPGSAPLAISSIQAGGGTEFFPALSMAHADLAATKARRRHIVLLTDGSAPSAGMDDLAGALATEGITLSTVALGHDADEALLQRMAAKSGGRFYHVSDPNELQNAFVGDLALARGRSKP